MSHDAAARHLWAVHDAPMDNYTGFASWLRAANCSDNTVEDRLGVLANFARDVPAFPHVTSAEVTNWLGRPGYAQWTRSTYYGHLRSYFLWAAETGIVQADPMARMRRPKPGPSVPRPLTPAQVRLVLDSATKWNMRAWLRLGLYAGLRAHEIAKICGQDVTKDQLWVVGKGGHGAYVPCHPMIWGLALNMPPDGLWFPSRGATGHVSSMTISTMTSRLFAANGITGSIHRCRHTFATELLRAGVNVRVVQTLMRHASLNSTMRYTAVDEAERRDAIALLMAA